MRTVLRGGVDVGQRRFVRLLTTSFAGALALLPLAVTSAVATEAGGPPAPEQPGPAAPVDDEQVLDDESTTPALGLSLVPVVGDAAGDGHLRRHGGSDVATLTFAPDRPEQQQAVFDVTVVNTGDVVLRDVAAQGPRLGTVEFDVTELAPGASATARAALEVTGTQARTLLGGLLEVAATASGTTPAAEVVTTAAAVDIEVVAVLASLSAEATLEVLVGSGDVVVGDDGVPVVDWPDGAVDATRRVPLRLTVINSGDVPLHDLTAVLDVLGRSSDVAVAAELAPGAEVVVDLVHEVRRADVVASGGTAPMTTQVTAVATVTGADASGTRPLSLRGTAELRAVVGRDEVVLPVAGAPTRPELTLVALLSLGLGASLLVAAPRPRAA